MPTAPSQASLYQTIGNVKTGRNISFYLTFILSVLPEILKRVSLPGRVDDFINTTNIVCILLYFGFDLIIEFVLLPAAHNKRRDDFMDNSFDSKFSLSARAGYFDNDDVGFGLYKAACNAFENCCFTYTLVKKMTSRKIIIPVLVLLSVFVFGYFGFKVDPIGLSMLQFLFSVAILGDIIKHLILITRLQHINDTWIGLFAKGDLKSTIGSMQAPVLRTIIQYESLVGGIDPDIPKSIFEKNNTALTAEWQQIKTRYQIV